MNRTNSSLILATIALCFALPAHAERKVFKAPQGYVVGKSRLNPSTGAPERRYDFYNPNISKTVPTAGRYQNQAGVSIQRNGKQFGFGK